MGCWTCIFFWALMIFVLDEVVSELFDDRVFLLTVSADTVDVLDEDVEDDDELLEDDDEVSS